MIDHGGLERAGNRLHLGETLGSLLVLVDAPRGVLSNRATRGQPEQNEKHRNSGHNCRAARSMGSHGEWSFKYSRASWLISSKRLARSSPLGIGRSGFRSLAGGTLVGCAARSRTNGRDNPGVRAGCEFIRMTSEKGFRPARREIAGRFDQDTGDVERIARVPRRAVGLRGLAPDLLAFPESVDGEAVIGAKAYCHSRPSGPAGTRASKGPRDRCRGRNRKGLRPEPRTLLAVSGERFSEQAKLVPGRFLVKVFGRESLGQLRICRSRRPALAAGLGASGTGLNETPPWTDSNRVARLISQSGDSWIVKRIPLARPGGRSIDLKRDGRPVSFAEPKEDSPVLRAADRVREPKHRLGLEPKRGAPIVECTDVVGRQ